MPHVQSFDPVVSRSSRILVLGTMPGKASLRAEQYYAHPRNLFWPIIEQALGIPSSAEYGRRVELLLASGIAMWDVVQLCTRESSLDSDIDDSSVVPNDVGSLLERYGSLQRVCFNGLKAASLFDRHIAPRLGGRVQGIEYVRLPSTSPANAAVPYSEKVGAWMDALTSSGIA
jgi:double-stranded uracil-DNA glycosylase